MILLLFDPLIDSAAYALIIVSAVVIIRVLYLFLIEEL